MKRFYRAELDATAHGIDMFLKTYFVCHESPCYWWVTNCSWVKSLQDAKAFGYQVRKIDKAFSRIAKATEEEAVEALKIRCRNRIHHLRRNLAFCQAVAFCDRKTAGLVDGTEELVHEYVRFE